MTTDMARTIVRRREERADNAARDGAGRAGPHVLGMLVSWVVLLIVVAGLILYLVPANPKVQEIGRLMFACGLLVLCFALGGKAVRLL
jgi:hypothetical protein